MPSEANVQVYDHTANKNVGREVLNEILENPDIEHALLYPVKLDFEKLAISGARRIKVKHLVSSVTEKTQLEDQNLVSIETNQFFWDGKEKPDQMVKLYKTSGFHVRGFESEQVLQMSLLVNRDAVVVFFNGDQVSLFEVSFFSKSYAEIQQEDTGFSLDKYNALLEINETLRNGFSKFYEHSQVVFTALETVNLDVSFDSDIALRVSVQIDDEGKVFNFDVKVHAAAIEDIFMSGAWGNPFEIFFQQVSVVLGPVVDINVQSSNEFDEKTRPSNDHFKEGQQKIGVNVSGVVTGGIAAARSTVRYIPAAAKGAGKIISKIPAKLRGKKIPSPAGAAASLGGAIKKNLAAPPVVAAAITTAGLAGSTAILVHQSLKGNDVATPK
jgi:hypothetical protein